MKIRLIGDVHGQQRAYHALALAAADSIQLGDLDFSYDWMAPAGLDPARHRFFGGNHDNYDVIAASPHNLGDFGRLDVPGHPDVRVFFVRGAWSIDKPLRTEGVDWWADEELSPPQLAAAAAAYAELRPDVLLSHDAPFHVLPWLHLNRQYARSFGHADNCIRCRTNQFLDRLYWVHRPRLHVFGHYHRDLDRVVDGTRYVCLTADPEIRRARQRFLDLDFAEAPWPK